MVLGACKYALWMIAPRTRRLFGEAYVRAIRTLSLDTTLAYVHQSGSGVLRPSLTHLALLSNVSLTSNVSWLLDMVYPGSGSLSFGRMKATFKFGISFSIVFLQCESLLILSNWYVSLMVLKISIPYWCLTFFILWHRVLAYNNIPIFSAYTGPTTEMLVLLLYHVIA